MRGLELWILPLSLLALFFAVALLALIAVIITSGGGQTETAQVPFDTQAEANNKAGASESTTPPERILPDGSFLYAVKDYSFWAPYSSTGRTELNFSTPEGYVTIYDVERNLVVIVDTRYEGTALIVYHFSNGLFSVSDNAALVVRSSEHKDLWDTAIAENVAKNKRAYEESLTPIDVVPRINEH